jgi:hypothetical protein
MVTKGSQAEASLGEHAEVDDFKRIPGIGPVIERHLHDCGILTYAQLAALTPQQIAEFVDHLPLLSVERIVRQDWPGRARDLARQAAAGDEAGERASAGQRYATFTVELLLDARNRVHRTRIVHLQDGAEQAWSGWSNDRLFTFFGAYAVVPDLIDSDVEREAMDNPSTEKPDPGLSAAAPIPDKAPAEPEELVLELGNLLIEEGLLDGTSAHYSDPGLRAKLSFSLSGPSATQLIAHGAPYSISILACDTTNSFIALVGEHHDRLRPDQQVYGPIVELVPPHEGRFQIFGALLIAEAGLVKSTLGPVLHVLA